VTVWHTGNGDGRINKVTLHQARTVVEQMTVFEQASHLGM